MAVIPSPSQAQQTLPSHTAYEDFAGPSNQTYQPSQGPSNRPQRGTTPVGGLASFPDGQNRRTKGFAKDLAGTHPNGELPEQTLSRSRTADNETLAHRPKPQLIRRRTDYERDRQSAFAAEETGELRHGWEDQYNSSEFLGLLSSVGLWPQSIHCRFIRLISEYCRPSTCISPTSDMRAEESQKKTSIQNHLRNGATRIVTKLSPQPLYYASTLG